MNKLLLLLLSFILVFTSCGNDDDASEPSFTNDPILGQWTVVEITEDGKVIDLGCGQNDLLDFNANGTYTYMASIEDSDDGDTQDNEIDETDEDELQMNTVDNQDTDEADTNTQNTLNCVFDEEIEVRKWMPNNNGTYTFIIDRVESVTGAQVEFTANVFTSTYINANGITVVERYDRI